MTELLSGYDKSTQKLMFRVYAEACFKHCFFDDPSAPRAPGAFLYIMTQAAAFVKSDRADFADKKTAGGVFASTSGGSRSLSPI